MIGDPNIVFIGEPGAGKSTAADILVELGWHKISFAGKHEGGLRDVVARVWGARRINDRELLNRVGMDVRAIDKDAWLNSYLREAGRFFTSFAIVTDDLRFQNEYDALRARGFVFVRVTAPRATRIERLKVTGKFQGEEQLDDFIQTTQRDFDVDHTVVNDAWRDDLYNELAHVIETERRKRL